MKHRRGAWLLFLGIPIAVVVGCAGRGAVRMVPAGEPIPEIARELRGAWVAASEWVHVDADSMRTRIDRTMQRLGQANYNAAFLEVRDQAETLYPSPLEPWSRLVGGADPGFDPVAHAIEAAHREGLELYAHIDLLSLWDEDQPPAQADHLYHRHGPHVDPTRSWVCFAEDGAPMARRDLYYLNPALPEVKSYLKRVVRHLVETQDLDGLHFGGMRYPGPEYLSDPYSTAQLSAEGAHTREARGDWARARLTDLVEDVATEALLVKPHLLISAATWGLDRRGGLPGYEGTASGYDTYYQDAIDWLDRGIVDFIVPAIHWDMANPRLIYANRVPIPDLKRTGAGQVFGLDVTPTAEASPAGQRVEVSGHPQAKWADASGRLGVILPERPDTLRVATGGVAIGLATRFWQTPYRYQVHADSTVSRASPWVEMRRAPRDTTDREDYHFLFRTEYPAQASVNGDSVKVYRTGVFFDSLGLELGTNRIRAEVIRPDSTRTVYEREFVRGPEESREPFPLWIDARSVQPRDSVVLLPEDVVRLSFRGSKGQRARARLRPGNVAVGFAREDRGDYSVYKADLPLRTLRVGKPHRIEIVLKSAEDAPIQEEHKQALGATIEVRELDELPLVRTTQAESRLSHSMGRVRLGGPYIAEYGPGVVMQTSGKLGRTYRVRLSSTQIGYIQDRAVEVLPDEAVRPGYHISSLHVAVSDSGDADVVNIPYPEPVPYAVIADPDHRQLLVNLYGVETASTWIQHRSGRRVVDKLTWRQTMPETYQVGVQLQTDRIWGYDLRVDGGWLVLRLPHPPAIGTEDGSQPLAGLRIAIEAGHGGENTGAVGLSGLLERDVNLDTALKLGALCEAAGMEVFQLRPDREGIPYMARRDSIEASEADLVVSIHTNAGGRGYLSVGGTSTYYHNPFWDELATRVYERLLDLGLGEFGVVGSFNYRITRVSSRPAILVEQAFASHAEDEERLADPGSRMRIAEQIFAGISDFVAGMPTDPAWCGESSCTGGPEEEE